MVFCTWTIERFVVLAASRTSTQENTTRVFRVQAVVASPCCCLEGIEAVLGEPHMLFLAETCTLGVHVERHLSTWVLWRLSVAHIKEYLLWRKIVVDSLWGRRFPVFLSAAST